MLLVAGIATAAVAGRTAGSVAFATAAAVLLYDAWGKHRTFIGPVNMGLCRALNLLLGVAALPSALASAWPLGLLPLTYIAAVTLVSRGEVHGARRPVAVLALLLICGVVLALAGVARTGAHSPVWALVLLVALSWRVLPAFWRVLEAPQPAQVRAAVRTGVLSLVLLNAVIAATYAGIIYSLAVLLTGLVAARLARVFAVT